MQATGPSLDRQLQKKGPKSLENDILLIYIKDSYISGLGDRNVAYSRDLLRGSLDLLVLSSLIQGERYGYQILNALRDESSGRVDLKAGTLYPILHKLEAEGSVKSRWEDGSGRDRKWYQLTDKGRQRLHEGAREWLDYAGCIRALLQPAFPAGAV